MPKGPKLPHAHQPIPLQTGRWQGRVTYYDELGKRHEQNQSFATKREANAWSREREQWLLQHPDQRGESQVFGPFLDQWLSTVHASRIRDTTLAGYQLAARHAKAALADKPLRALTPLNFQRLYQTLIEAGLAPSTVRQVHVVCRQALNAAVDYGLVAVNPVLRAKPPRVTQTPITPPSPTDAMTFLRVADSHPLKAFWYFLALSGCRRGEALGLQWTDIDWERKTAAIRTIQVGKGRQRRLHAPKTQSGARTLALSDFLVAILRNHQDQQRAAWSLDHPGEPLPPWVFTTRRGTWLAGDNVRRTFKILLRRAGLPETTRIHDLRHAMATTWLSQGVPVKVVSERLGHASIAITLQLYAHVLPGMQHAAANQIDSWLTGAESGTAEDSAGPPKEPSHG